MKNPVPYLPNSVYDVLKYIAQIVLPASGTLYFALSQIWGFPAGEQVMGTILAVNAFLGVLLGLSTVSYNKSDAWHDGTLQLIETDEVKNYSLNLDGHPEELDEKDRVVFKVEHATDSFFANKPPEG